MAVNFFVQLAERAFHHRGGLIEVAGILGNFRRYHQPRLETLSLGKILLQAFLQRNLLRLIFDGLGLFGGQLEVAVLFHFAPRGLPPFLIIILVNHLGHECLLHFIGGGINAIAVDDNFNHLMMLQRGHLFEAGHVCGFARLDVFF